MKVFLDRISDFLDLPDLMIDGRRLRGKTAYVVCTSISDEAPEPFVGSFTDTFAYLGIRFGGIAHANCKDGYICAEQDLEVERFVRLIRSNVQRIARA